MEPIMNAGINQCSELLNPTNSGTPNTAVQPKE